MKKQIFLGILISLMLIPTASLRAQSTEGKEFWATFLQADHRDDEDKNIQLSLTFSSRSDCQVTIDNPYFPGKSISARINGVAATKSLPFTVDIQAGVATEVEFYKGTAKSTNTNNEFCYTRRSEQVDSTVLHITATEPISVFASNYKEASFDASNVLPVAALQSNYLIQCFTPSDHKSKPQGSHFAIVATEDNTIATYILSERTSKHQKGDTVVTKPLKAGQVWYVWTGDGEGVKYDLSGTTVSANKPIAVFQGNPHTNLPYHKDFGLSSAIQQRDHLFSQAMPTSTWGNTFAIARTARKRDVLRIMALNDGTEVRINGELKKTFNFSKDEDKKQYWEIQIGDAISNGGKNGNETRPDADVAGGSCFIETSCPCAVHLFIVSQEWDGKRNNNDGDPSMLWVNPIEQKIDQITFSTFSSKNGTTYHYVNVITDSVNVRTTNKMMLDGDPLTGWEPIVGSDKNNDGEYRYYYVRHAFATTEKDSKPLSHTLKLDGAEVGEGFIAYVYGFTSNESYGYNAGGAAKPLTQYITINGEIYYADSENPPICDEDGDGIIDFTFNPDYDYEKIEWYFGDGESDLSNKDQVSHFYAENNTYNGYVLIYRASSNLCAGLQARDSIPFVVPIGNYKVDVLRSELPYCSKEGDEVDLKVYLDNPDKVSLTGDSVKITFNSTAKADGFKEDAISIIGDSILVLHLPKTAKNRTPYSLHLHIGAQCKTSTLDKDLDFQITFDIPVLAQRYNNVLGVLRDSFPTQELTNFVWFHDGDTVPDQETSVLYLDEKDPKNSGEYYVCFIIKEKGKADIPYCTCPIKFYAESKQHEFEANPDSLTITATYVAAKGGKVFVNVDYNGESNLNCYAEWYDVSGRAVAGGRYENLPDGGCTIDAPSTAGLYLLRVVTGKGARSFKFIVNN